MADKFKSMMAWRTPVGKGNGLPLKGKSPASMFGPKPTNILPAKKAK